MEGNPWIMLCFLLIQIVVPVLAGGEFAVVAPRLVHYDVPFTVLVTVAEGSGASHSHSLTLRVLNHDDTSQEIARQQQTVTAGQTSELRLTVPPFELTDLQALARRHFVVLEAEVDGETRLTPVEVDGRSHLVLLQTDKSIYRPGQTVYIDVITTDDGGDLAVHNIILNVKSPADIIVDRLNVTTSTNVEGRTFPGIWHSTYTLEQDLQEGDWTLEVLYGHKGAHSKSIKIEVKDYDIPTFSCEISDVPQYILPDTRVIAAKVTSRHTFNKAVEGSAELRFALDRTDGTRLVFMKQVRQLIEGQYEFHVNLTHLENKLSNFRFESHVEGHRLRIESDCFEKSTGMIMSDSTSHTLFVTSPYVFDWERSKKYFQPYLPFTLQFTLKHANGRIADGVTIRVAAKGVTSSGAEEILQVIGSSRLTSNAQGHTQVQFAKSQMKHIYKRVVIEFSTHDPKQMSHWYPATRVEVLPSPARTDIVVEPFFPEANVGSDIFLNIYFKGQIRSFTYVVLSRGMVLPGTSETIRRSMNQDHYFLTIPTSPAMVPSVRVVVFYVQDGKIGASSIFLDVNHACSEKLHLDVEEERVSLGAREKRLSVEVKGEAGAFVLAQMIDKSLLLLSEDQRITMDKVQDTFEELDTGCAKDLGKTAAHTLSASGIAIATTQQTTGHTSEASTLKEDLDVCRDKSRKKRSTNTKGPQTTPLAECCDHGRQAQGRCDQEATARLLAGDIDVQCAQKFLECCREEDSRPGKPGPGLPGPGTDGILECSREEIMRGECVLPIQPQPPIEEGQVETKDQYDNGLELLPDFNGEPKISRERSWTDDDDSSLKILSTAEGVRHNFPESVYIGIGYVDRNRHLRLPFILPDTITTWSIQGLQLGGTAVCAAASQPISVEKNLFIKVNLPTRAIQGERLQVKTTFYRYDDSRGTESVKLEIDTPPQLSCNQKQKYVRVMQDSSKTADWMLVATEAGEYSILVTAKIRKHVVDQVMKTISIDPPGIPKVKSVPFLLDPTSDNNAKGCSKVGGKLKCDVQLTTTHQVVANTSAGQITITGNLGPAVDIQLPDPQDHISIPQGGADQIMMKLGPAVYAYRYMKLTNSVTEEATNTFRVVLKRGVLGILNFRQEDGGVSFWSEYPSNTWLTAFALKTLSEAQKLAGGLDQNLLQQGENFLLQQHASDGSRRGSFRENGPMNTEHTDMMGQIKSEDKTLAAYVLISLKESHPIVESNTAKHDMTLHYLAPRTSHIDRIHTAYEAALVAYALALGDHQYKDHAYRHLKTKAQDTEHDGTTARHFPGPSGTQKSIQVETAAYAVLTALRHNDFDYCYNIVVWLHKTRNNAGLFHNTQDTVIALQALAEYAARTRTANPSLHVKVIDVARRDAVTNVNINEQNANTAIRTKLNIMGPNAAVSAHLDVSGSGTAQAVMELKYHVTQASDWKRCDVSLKISTTDETDNTGQKILSLKLCLRSKTGKPVDTTVLEVGLLSGYSPRYTAVKELLKEPSVLSISTSNKLMAIHLKEVPSASEKCLRLEMNLDSVVTNMHPALIRIIDYQNIASMCIEQYKVESSTPVLDTGPRLMEPIPNTFHGQGRTPCSSCVSSSSHLNSVILRNNADAMQDVLKLTYVRRYTSGRYKYFVMRIVRPIESDLFRRSKISLRRLKSCPCQLDHSTTYLLMGNRSQGRRHSHRIEFLWKDIFLTPWQDVSYAFE